MLRSTIRVRHQIYGFRVHVDYAPGCYPNTYLIFRYVVVVKYFMNGGEQIQRLGSLGITDSVTPSDQGLSHASLPDTIMR